MSFHGLSHAFLIGAGASAIGFGISLKITQLAVSCFPKLQERVDKLDNKARKYFFVTGPSTLHSLVHVLGTGGFLLRLEKQSVTTFDDRLIVDYGWTSLGPAFYAGVFAGYLMADAVYLGIEDLGPMYVLHHFSAATNWTLCDYTRCMQFLASFLQFNEFSTIFMNARQVLLTAGYDSKGKHVMAASYVFFLSFFLVRVIPLPMIVYKWISNDFRVIKTEAGTPTAAFLSFCVLAHVSLQSTWFAMMLRKVLGGKSKKEKKS
mmetsp:Transcript_12323/g.18074  ORF Transcript_12323/g.18074 Transcript_12323/m.18074 type:complete len:262 (-) Transcript_12323:202-987(-)